MSKELDVHSLPDSHSRHGNYLQKTRECGDCPFSRTIVNRDWAPGGDPIGEVCAWGKEWKWLKKWSWEKPKACAKLSRPLSPESVSLEMTEEDYVPCGITPDKLTKPLFVEVVGLYAKIVGVKLWPYQAEAYYRDVHEVLRRTNGYDLRIGSYVSGDSKFTIEKRYSTKTNENLLLFGCYPQAHSRDDQGQYLGSRFEMAVNQLLTDEGIAKQFVR